ncbi:MAG: inositol monophosphatase [Calditrichaeota bacterium]|nr:MAG: inositol monophosphatase [Calditrichota bacterium]
MKGEQLNRYLQVAREAALRAGEFLRQAMGQLHPEEARRKGSFDFVTTVDTQAEALISEYLLSAFPEHQILAEEGGLHAGDETFRWIVDPLDGTKNYLFGIPFFCVSIALAYRGTVVAGVVYDPLRDECFWAGKNGGAFCNQKAIAVSPQSDLSRMMLATGFPHRNRRHLPAYLLAFEEIFLRCAGIRRCGSAALDLCYTASGRFGGYFELGLNIWDIAAGSLIVQEAGGIITDFWNRSQFLQNGAVVAGNKTSHTFMQRILGAHFRQPFEHLTHEVREK